MASHFQLTIHNMYSFFLNVIFRMRGMTSLTTSARARMLADHSNSQIKLQAMVKTVVLVLNYLTNFYWWHWNFGYKYFNAGSCLSKAFRNVKRNGSHLF